MARTYWEKRAIARQDAYDRAAAPYVAKIENAYNRAARQLKEDIKNILGNFQDYFGLDKKEAEALLKKPAPTEVLAQLRARANALPKGPEKLRIQAELSAPAYAARIARIQAIQEAARVSLAEVAPVEIEADTGALSLISAEAYGRTMFDVQKAGGFMFPVSGMSTQRTAAILAENWSGTIFSKRVWKNTEATARIVSTALHEMVMAGKASRETYAAVIDHAVLGGKYAANRLLRTEYNFVSGQAELLSYEDAGVEKYRYVAVLDGRTSKICRDLDGQVFPVKDRRVGVNMHPMHPWCRSSTEPVLSSDTRALEKRWARDPVTGEEMKVPADMTYREWEKKMESIRKNTK